MIFRKRQNEERYIVAGLGNPGKKYHYTRHNVGFLALDYIAERAGVRVSRSRFSALVGEGRIGGVAVTLMKPLTFMNLSGQAVAAAARYYGTAPAHIVVICDDATLPPGDIRIRDHGSSGGQKGLQSVEDMLESSEYIRIRIGIGRCAGQELSDYVLSMPASADREAITGRFPDVADALDMVINGNISEAQSHFNGAGTKQA
ncbi:MAG: aminoacyl-tRNA hydrolase [Oscillospiraceae bacterium]|nr:aminoacyl-tRNA hydrolase [Oscillospiraceae bacterium]